MANRNEMFDLMQEMRIAAANEDEDYANEVMTTAFKFTIEFLPSWMRGDARQLLHLYLTNEEDSPTSVPKRFLENPIPTANDVKEEIFQAIHTGFALSVFGYASDVPQDATIFGANDDEPDEPAWVMRVATADKHLYEVWLRDRGVHTELQIKGEENDDGNNSQ